MRGVLAAGLFCVVTAAMAQAPAPAGNTLTPATPPATAEQDKGGEAISQPPRRAAPARPGDVPPPANIRIRGEGIKMPECARESRDGEACKK